MNKKSDETEIVLIRHAQSQWNIENRFTGWADPQLTDAGVAEARMAGRLLCKAGYLFDQSYSSKLQRATHTLAILQEELRQTDMATRQDWRLNERHYGALQGLNKTEMMRQAGEEQVNRWRRGYLDLPPRLPLTDPGHPVKDARYADIPADQLPSFENLDLTRERVMAFWESVITPHLKRRDRLLISTHGNTLRALLMALGNLSVAEVETLEIPTASPIVYRFDQNGNPLAWRYLEDRQCIGCAA